MQFASDLRKTKARISCCEQRDGREIGVGLPTRALVLYGWSRRRSRTER